MEQQVTAQSKKGQFISRILQEFHPSRLLPSLTAGIVIGLLDIVVEISLATLIFSGVLWQYVSNGIGFTLFGACAFGIIMALTSSFPGTIAIPQDSSAAILALVAAAITANMSTSTTPDTIFFTVVAAIVLTSLLTGLFFSVLGICKLGSLVRFIPYPIVGGFLAGTGWLLVKGSVGVMTDMSLSFSQLPPLFQANILIKWLPGLLFAVLLLLVLRRYSHFLVMPAMILGGIGLFYLLLLLTGTPLSEASAQGWLLGPFPEGGLWRPLTLSALNQIDWSAIFGQIGNIGTILVISLISLLLNASGLELAVRHDIDLNRELRSAGIANIVAGLGGSPAGYHALSLSALGHKLGSKSRLGGVFFAAVCGGTLFFGASLLSFFPKPVLGGLLLFLGLSFLTEWLYDAWFTLPKTDYVLVLLILGVIGTIGFLEGVAVGGIVAVVLFVINYSRINVIKHVLSGVNYQSNVDRAMPYQRLLRQKGEQMLILKLQGFLFFGTAHNLLDQIRQRVAHPDLPPLGFVVFDFHLVTGLDSSALNSFAKMKQLAEIQKIMLVFTHLSSQIRRQFEVGGYTKEDDPVVRIFRDLDHGVEWCEEQVLVAEDSTLAETGKTVQEHYGETFLESVFDDIMESLEQQEKFESVVADMMPYFERQEVEVGHYLIRQGDPPDALYFVEFAVVTVQLESEDGKIVRLRTMGPGTVVGELGFYLGQRASASVVVQQPGTVYRFSADALHRMQENDPKLAALFHEFIARLLGERLVNMNTTLQALLD